MPTLPLYLPDPGDPDASHRVTAPGGYEWWSFVAESETGDVHFVARFYDGFLFHPEYLRRYARYRRRPTRHAPPVPAEYPRVEFAVYENGRPPRIAACDFPAGSFSADGGDAAARVGPHEFRREGDSLRLRLDAASLSADLAFRSRLPHRPYECALLPRGPAGAEHRWVLSDALCDVEGSIRVDGGARTIAFTGRGYRDHRYGTAPPSKAFECSIQGTAVVGGSVYAFHHASGRYEDFGVTTLLEADAAGVREVAAKRTTVVRSIARGATCRLPKALSLAGGELMLTNPRPIGNASSGRLVAYDAAVGGGVVRGAALCEVGRSLYRPGVN